jgi:hypothetical protein
VNQEKTGQGKLWILWTSGDREVAEKMVFMYARNSRLKGWWDQVVLMVWGASAQLLCQDQGLQEMLKELLEAGVEVQACQACADLYSVSDQLRFLGVDVKYLGAPLTDILKRREHLLAV